MKKTLVIHPKDPSTDFLCPIYENIENKTVLRGKSTGLEIRKHIQENDRIIMLGHGYPRGLFSMGMFDTFGCVIDAKTVPYLKDKECIAIWCNADQFMNEHNLKGFYSGMFISEVGEADYCGVKKTLPRIVTESNNKFSEILAQEIDKPFNEMHEAVTSKYSAFAIMTENKISEYNCERLYFRN